MRVIDAMRNETKSVKWIVDSTKSGNLYVDNSFQRNYVWSRKDQVKLIETILLGYSIPEIYLYNSSIDPETGEERISIIDGQQRIGSIYDFINNDFRLSTSHLSADYKDASFSNKHFKDLDNDDKKKIWHYPFSARVINTSIGRNELIELFLRLNATDKSLNPQELRNAEFNGEFIKLTESIAEWDFWKKIFAPGKIRRMSDMEFISQILIYFRFGVESELNQEAINKAYDLFNENYPKKEADYNRFQKIINILDSLSMTEYLAEFIKKVTHLYTTIITLDYFIQTKTEITDSITNRLEYFSRLIWNLELFNKGLTESELNALTDYLQLSTSGTRSKTNRVQRINILKNFLLETF